MSLTTAPAIVVTGLHKSYGRLRVLDEVSLTVESGAIQGLVGLNGSGKTTTMECLLGLQRFDGGSVELLGHKPAHLHRANGRIVGIFDTPSLNPALTVRQSLQQAALLCPKTVRTPAETEALLGIERYRDFRIHQLSLGNKRRAAIAHALLANPELVILDEPFNGLDAGGVDDVLALIASLNQGTGSTFLLSSHQLPYLERVCSHIAILHQGRIAAAGTISDLLSQAESVVLLRSPAVPELTSWLAQQNDFSPLPPGPNGYQQVALGQHDSAELNARLVAAGIPVQELILERASLEKLFRGITREATT